MEWQPTADWRRITTIDSHAEGEPLRLVTGGIDPIPGKTIIEKRKFARKHLDGLRRMLMFEPRGHADMYGAILTEPVTEDGDVGVLFMHNEGWSTMCGHGIIAISTIALETGMLPMSEVVRFDTPAGRITAHVRSKSIQQPRVTTVAFENVPSFVYAVDQTIEVPKIGPVQYDIAWGGAFYAFVKASDIGVGLTPNDFNRLVEYGMAIKRAIMRSREPRHPFESALSFLYGTIFVGPSLSREADTRSVCVYADGAVDRSPCGTGVSARLAIEYINGRLKPNETLTVESILGTRFIGRVIGTTTFDSYKAVVTQVEGRAWITGRNEFLLAPDDSVGEGFIFR
jgi:proline racemase